MKKLFAIITVVLCLTIFLFLIVFFHSGNERLEPSYILTQSCLVNGLSDTTFVSIGEVANHTEIPIQNDTILNSLHLDAWAKSSAPQDEETCKLVVHLGDEYDMYIYDSYAYIYDGYADFGKNTGAYYTLPEKAVQDIDSFILNR